MAAKVLRKIIQIDENNCTGCGECITSCAEGALALVNGKAKLVKEKYCDGLAACLKECPSGALKIVEREAEGFDEEAAMEHVKELKQPAKPIACGCPGSAVREIKQIKTGREEERAAKQSPMLSHWPVQLTLVPAGAKFLDRTDVMLIADCVPFAYPDMHVDFIKDHSVLVACPKLDNAEAHLAKLTEILKKSDINSLTVLHMEVPCCSGLVYIAQKALAASGKNIPFKEITIGVNGEILD
jgi:ferredoxin